ncbi:MAG: hypothetical protein KGR48_03965 [Alphaproteobacteria bacterium]|nr:hypothetical protein [Alphaproteobacteria bacterium]MBU6472180.1 hypothetical protein [Alphaproteobacteria bacterium]MDE2013994.1 hypothetical protein [Alphaproteobacteria bacterium]MDE2072611.1 hypothetical protein [Alphaproteobacteria bacterium]MDE2351884.1 hypothetical protein [Alphaproteobacteria bacterium]
MVLFTVVSTMSMSVMADGAEYRVVMTQSGLNAEPANDATKKANGPPT